MKCHLKYLGVVDTQDNNHIVEFSTGVNIITGKSSTGKSALMEIFDYCMGCSEYTIPEGVVTKYAEIFFIVLAFEHSFLVLARQPIEKSNKIFFKPETTLPDLDKFNMHYFEDTYFLANDSFNVKLSNFFGLNITDTDTDLEDKKYRVNNRKKERPSIRNIMPFLLQHQDLIANKHSLFYRFDESRKKEQTIEQFKIFTSFVTQDYFLIMQEISEIRRTLKSLENRKKQLLEERKYKSEIIEQHLKDYQVITGIPLSDNSIDFIYKNPQYILQELDEHKITVDTESNEYLSKLNQLREIRNSLLAQKMNLVNELNKISFSVNYADEYKKQLNELAEIGSVDVHLSECPFCHTHNEVILHESNQLVDAIKWLNSELRKTPLMLDSFKSEQQNKEKELNDLNVKLTDFENAIKKIENISNELKSNKSLEDQALKIKLKIENLLENLSDQNLENLNDEIQENNVKLESLEIKLKDDFDLSKHTSSATKFINKSMTELGTRFDFEEYYKPINLKFSLDNFELWNEMQQKRIYLRSMGSGANWLYSHLTLFLSLHRYFCKLGNKSLIPPILFLDQPSQVYFPTSIKDTEDEFNAEELKRVKDNIKEDELVDIDEDLKAVTDLFDNIVLFCNETLNSTQIEPQIIITDHADKLNLKNADFETLVNGRRWRTRGFIDTTGYNK